MDRFTLDLRSLLRFFGADHPLRLGLAIALGLVVDGARLFCIGYTEPSDPLHRALLKVDSVTLIAAAVVALFLPFVVGGRRQITERARQYFDLIDEGAERLGLSDFERRHTYRVFLDLMARNMAEALTVNPAASASEAIQSARTPSQDESAG